MLTRVSIRAGSIRRVFALIAVYSIHLVCFQSLMEASPSHKKDNFKPLFVHHPKATNNQPPNHPAVTYYTQLMKQGKDVRGLTEVLPAVNQMEAVLPTTPSILAAMFSRYQSDVRCLHLADGTFKLYRLVSSFLI